MVGIIQQAGYTPMSLRFHEIVEANHRILNPLTEDKLMLLGEICGLHSATRQLDLACGKGEMLIRWAERYGIHGVGVDISTVFLEAAQLRAKELQVWSQVNFVEGDAAEYPQPFHEFNIVSCIGATWIGDGLVGTIELMKPALRDERSLLLVGEVYYIETPPPEALVLWGFELDDYTSLDGMLERFDAAGVELVEMVLADENSWDRYEASQWWTANNWLRENPDNPDAQALREWNANNRRVYLQYGRRCLGWGVFALRVKQ